MKLKSSCLGIFKRAKRMREHASKYSPPFPYSTLPPELWFEILQFLGPPSASVLCLTSKYFARLSQPFVFQNISFRPGYSSKSSHCMDNLSTRLIFMSNPNIAHRVRKASIFSETRAGNSFVDAALELILHTLSSFPNLSELSCISIEITSRLLRSLLLVPTAALKLQFCTYNSDLDTDRTPVDTLICSNDHRLSQGPSSSEAPSVSPFLHAQHLKKLVVGHTDMKYILSAIANSVETFSRLYSLDIPVDSLTMDNFIPAMSSCPEVRHLSLHFLQKPPQQYLTSITSHILPNLTSFAGPHQYASLFAKSRTFSYVTLRPFDNFTSFCNPGPLHKTLIDLGPQIEKLDIYAVVDVAALFTALSPLKSLRSLAINAHPEFYSRCIETKQLIDVLKPAGESLPAGLEAFTVGVRLSNSKSLTDAEAVIAAAVMACPSLKNVGMWNWAYPRPRWTIWHKVSSPHFEISHHNPCEAAC